MSKRLVLTLALAGLTGCGDPAGPGGGATPITDLPRALSAAELELIDVTRTFSFDLLREVQARETDANVFLSPLSASMALGMALNGARGETRTQMAGALGLGELDVGTLNGAYRTLTTLLTGLDPAVELGIANAAFARLGVPLSPSFQTTLEDEFGATVDVLDFATPGALEAINGWASDNTNGRIPKVLDFISPDAVLFLMNAIYFKADWTAQFDRANTRSVPFHLDDGSTVQVETMHADRMPIRLHFSAGVTVAELPYGGDAFSLVVALPPEGTPLDEFVAGLTRERWDGWTAGLGPLANAAVALPRLELSYESILNDALKALGMVDAFAPGAADLSGMFAGDYDAFISFVKQNTFLRIDEVGTEAAAVTTIGAEVTSAPPSLVVDRPYVIAIRERLSGTLLFIGAIGDPR